jgi:hypothetical protein
MLKDWLRRTIFGEEVEPSQAQDKPDIPLVPASENPWGVPVLDVRPVTTQYTSVSENQMCAMNAISFGDEDGRCFASQKPKRSRSISASIDLPIDRKLADGVLFSPREMEQKWALFVYGDSVIFVRSWTRGVSALARFTATEKSVRITEVIGTFSDDEEPEKLTRRTAEFLIRAHALGEVLPAPVPEGSFGVPYSAALLCMSLYGRAAHFAAEQEARLDPPPRPLRSHSLLHIGVARGDLALVDNAIAEGTPVDLLAGDGLSALHWAMAPDGAEMIEALIDRGCPVDVRSDEGATPLMSAVQQGDLAKARLLIFKGAEVDAADSRGFTALHRAAEMNHQAIVAELIAQGASPGVVAAGHTPLSLAESQQNSEVCEMIKQALR